MAGPNKTQIAVAASNRSNQPILDSHLTTCNFMEFSVAKAMEIVPKQSIKVDHSLFARYEAMPVPTFGDANIHVKSYFVPFRTVFPGWNDFIDDVAHVYSNGNINHITSVPSIETYNFVTLFSSVSYGYSIVGSAENYDLVFTDTDEVRYRLLTPLGKRVYKILISLGYKLYTAGTNEAKYVSLMPLFCLGKAYIDWYYPSQYSQDNRVIEVQKWFTFDLEFNTDVFGLEDLDNLLKLIVGVNYSGDYYTNAWDNPNGPNQGSYSDFTLLDINNTSGSIGSGGVSTYGPPTDDLIDGTPRLNTGTASAITKVTQFGLTALRALTDYMKRHQIVGARALDRYLSRWGISLPAEKLNRSMFLGGYTIDSHFGDVTSTSDTAGAQLGDYAGKGVAFGNGSFDFSSDEFGYFFIVTSVVPDVSFYQGVDRCVKHLSKLDFFTPEFDNLGVQAMGVDELYVPQDGRMMYPLAQREGTEFASFDWDDLVFGFVPRYGEYKIPKNIISGDYLLKSKSPSMQSWTLARNLDFIVGDEGGQNFVHSVDFVQSEDAQQYNRIFYNTSDNIDHINLKHFFRISNSFPGKSLYDEYEFENEDESKKVNVDVGGSKAN